MKLKIKASDVADKILLIVTIDIYVAVTALNTYWDLHVDELSLELGKKKIAVISNPLSCIKPWGRDLQRCYALARFNMISYIL